MQSWSRQSDHPLRQLVGLFAVWKALLLLIVVCSPSVGYDTSTDLSFAINHQGNDLPLILRHIVGRLTRWDGIYYVTVAKRGYLFEQEWAFGWGFTRLIALCTTGLTNLGVVHYDGLEGIIAIVIAHLAHLFSVLLLFKLSLALFGRASRGLAFTAALLHIISPAGVFLSGPYTESSCSFLTFAGCLNFVKSFTKDGKPSAQRDSLLLLSGIMFGAATTFRSNGILNGLLLLEEAFRVLYQLRNGFNFAVIRRLLATGLGGIFVGAGFFLPQYIAYREYCSDASIDVRPWCTRTIPSIYTFVQDYYWNCGLFRYWTLSNIPLFLLGAPMFALLTISSLWALLSTPVPDPDGANVEQDPTKKRKQNLPRNQNQTQPASSTTSAIPLRILRNLALSQLLLVLITLTTAHVQIITRISSACPVWIWYITALCQNEKEDSDARVFKNVVRFMVVYAVVQGGLFASFLPPA